MATSLDPKDGHLVFLRFKHRDRRVRAHRRIDPRVQDLREILRLFARILVPDHDNSANHEENQRRHSGRTGGLSTRWKLREKVHEMASLANDPFAELMAEEIFVA